MSTLGDQIDARIGEIEDFKLRAAVEDALAMMRAPSNLEPWAANMRAATAYGYTAGEVAKHTGAIASLVRKHRKECNERALKNGVLYD